jgi:hypothetical protein
MTKSFKFIPVGWGAVEWVLRVRSPFARPFEYHALAALVPHGIHAKSEKTIIFLEYSTYW